MQSSELAQVHYPAHLSMTQNNTPTFDHHLFNPLYHFQITPQLQELNHPRQTYFGNNSTSDEADEQQQSLVDLRKQRRMISNRESARRSRIRKQRHLDELWSQVLWLRNENQQLIEKLHDLLDQHDRFVQENAQLKEEASELRQLITNMQINSP